MKGLVKQKPSVGAVLDRGLPIPAVGDNDVLVKVSYAAVCGTDLHIYDWTQYARDRLKLPMVFGHEFSGEIVETGKAVSRCRVGDRVAGETHIPCNNCIQCRTGNQHICEKMKIIGVHVPGAFGDYIAVPQDCIWKLDSGIDDKTAALLEPMGVAMHGVMAGEIGGKSCLILGCGPIGLMAVGIAAASGASLVMAIDLEPRKLEVAKRMGADLTVNNSKEDYTSRILAVTGGRGADVVIDYTGHSPLIAESFRALRKGGRYTLVGLPSQPLTIDLSEAVIYKEAQVNGVTGRQMYQTWYQCADLLERGKIDLSKIVAGIYSLDQYEQAFSDLKSGMPGKVLFQL